MHENHDLSPEDKPVSDYADLIILTHQLHELALQGLSPKSIPAMRELATEISEMLAGGSA